MKYPKYLSLGNWLFTHIETYNGDCVGGPRPHDLYLVTSTWHSFDLGKDIRTYGGLIASGATEPSREELIRLLEI